MASMILSDGRIVAQTVRNSNIIDNTLRVGSLSKEVFPARASPVTQMPIAILINHGSASASEVFAGALQDNGRYCNTGSRAHQQEPAWENQCCYSSQYYRIAPIENASSHALAVYIKQALLRCPACFWQVSQHALSHLNIRCKYCKFHVQKTYEPKRIAKLFNSWCRAVTVGEQSYGKGVVQHYFPFPDGSGLKVTVLKYLTPKGHDISRTGGIKADFSCSDHPRSGQPSQTTDACIDTAIHSMNLWQ